MKFPSIHTFSSLSDRVYRIYFIGMAGQWASMNMQIVARALLVYRISDSGIVLGLTALANTVPIIIFSLWGGAAADRLRKRSILFLSMLGSMFLSLVVAACLMTGALSSEIPGSWWILIVTSVLQGSIMGIVMPARQSIISDIVRPDLLMNAVSLNTMGMNAFRILAPAATDFLIAAYDFHVVYLVSACLYGIAAVAMFRLPRTAAPAPVRNTAFQDIVEGFKYLKAHRTTLYVLIFTLFGMVCSMPFVQLMPMITDDILMVGEEGMGILLSVSGGGAIIGSLVLASMPNRRRGLIMLITGGVMGLGLVVFGFSSWWWVSLVAVVFAGIGQSGYRTTGNTLAQHYTEAEYRGRVMSFFMMEIGFSGLGTFFAGILAEYLGVQWAIGGLAAVFVLASLVALVFSPRLRRLD